MSGMLLLLLLFVVVVVLIYSVLYLYTPASPNVPEMEGIPIIDTIRVAYIFC